MTDPVTQEQPNPAAVPHIPAAAALPDPVSVNGVAADTGPVVTPDAPPVESAPAPAPNVPAAEPSLLEKFDKQKPAELEPAKAAEAKPGEAAPTDPVQAAPLAPVNYEYTLPEALKMDDGLKADVHKAFDAFRADPAKGAQGLIDLHAKTMQDYANFLSAEQHRIFNETRRGWVQEVLSDPQIGGSGHRTAMGAIARMRDQFVAEADRPAFEEFLRVTGAGDHPQFLKLLHNVSRFYDEPPLPPPNPRPTPTNGLPPKRGMRSLYTNSGS